MKRSRARKRQSLTSEERALFGSLLAPRDDSAAELLEQMKADGVALASLADITLQARELLCLLGGWSWAAADKLLCARLENKAAGLAQALGHSGSLDAGTLVEDQRATGALIGRIQRRRRRGRAPSLREQLVRVLHQHGGVRRDAAREWTGILEARFKPQRAGVLDRTVMLLSDSKLVIRRAHDRSP